MADREASLDCEALLTWAVIPPPRQDTVDPEARDPDQVIDFIVHEADLREPHPAALTDRFQMQALVPPRLLVEDALLREERIDTVSFQQAIDRGTVLGGCNGQLDTPAQLVKGRHELRIRGDQAVPTLRLGLLEAAALAIEGLVKLVEESRCLDFEIRVILRLVADRAALRQRRELDAEILRPIAQGHHLDKVAIHGGSRELLDAGFARVKDLAKRRLGIQSGVRTQRHEEDFGCAVCDYTVEVECQDLRCQRSLSPADCAERSYSCPAWMKTIRSHKRATGAMLRPVNPRLKSIGIQLLPWFVSACALIYVFGFRIDWHAIPEATDSANMPLFVAITVWDKISFFICWGLLQAMAVRRFIEPVPIRKVMAVKGASELVRTVNNSLADATFLYGVTQLVRSASVANVVAVASIPFVTHAFVLLIQVTIVLPLLSGGMAQNMDVVTAAGICWLVVIITTIGVRRGYLRRLVQRFEVGAWIDNVKPREMLPFVGWFMLFGIYDVMIQGFAARAFGLHIDWGALVARIPIMYIALVLPSLGNFGTREIAWASLFQEYGSRESLYAFALWTNSIFLAMHVLVGSIFLSRAMSLVREVRAARAKGVELPTRILRHPIDS